MPDNQTSPRPPSRPKPGAHTRLAGIIILAFGLVTAGLVYGLSNPPDTSPDEMATPDNSKIAARDIRLNYGQMGAFSYTLGEDLKNPAFQAGLIAGFAILISGVCFYIAHLQTRDPHNQPRT